MKKMCNAIPRTANAATLTAIIIALYHLTRIRLQRAIYFCLHRGSLPENTAGRQPRFRGKTCAQNFRKKLYVRRKSANWAAVFVDASGYSSSLLP